MNIKRLLSLLLVLASILSMMTGLAYGVPAREEMETKGVSLTTDAAFFAKLNLNASGMSAVKSAVSAKDYTLAKQELLNFCKSHFGQYNPPHYSSASTHWYEPAMQDTYTFSEHYRGSANVTATTPTRYEINLGGDISGLYILSSFDKTTDEIAIASRSVSGKAPQLIVTCPDGSSVTLTATGDGMVRAGSYSAKNYGTDATLYVKDHYTKNSDGTYTPYGNDTKRVYLRFDASKIPTNAKKATLVLYANRVSGSASGAFTEASLRLNVMGSYCKTWTESNLTWDYLKSINALAHFSWKGIPGGFDWKKPAYTPSEWLNYNDRFCQHTALVQKAKTYASGSAEFLTYMNKAKELVLDFINDAGAGTPLNRDIEAANRSMEFPYIYKQFLESNILTAEENVKILSWVYDEAAYLKSGAKVGSNTYLFNDADPGKNHAYAYTNRGIWHVTGLYAMHAYFDFFTEADSWKTSCDLRFHTVMDTLVHEDGSYNEITFSYPRSVILWSMHLRGLMKDTGDSSTAAITLIQKMSDLAKYLVQNSMSNDTPPFWGQGQPGSLNGSIQTLLDSMGTENENALAVQNLRYFLNPSEGLEPETWSEYDEIKTVSDRTGWNTEDSFFFMNAKSGGNHSHRDALAVLLYYRGRSLLTDTGMTSYDSSHPHFAWQNRTTRSHNTIEIDGTAQSLQATIQQADSLGDIDITANDAVSTVTAWTKASGKTVAKGQHSTDFTHYRNVSFYKELGDFLIVTDKVVPGDSASHTYTQNWHAAPYSNPSVASDSYKTGKTAYTSGPNLIIAQSSNSSNASTASLGTGYDASAPGSSTKYFEYKQSGAGTVTYQTVLYPTAAGTTATVAPQKLTMSGTDDATALATKVSITDSDNADLKYFYHYSSFETTPGTRSFDGYTTNASTAALNLNSSSKATFAYIANGSSLQSGSVILSSSLPVSDLTAIRQGTTLKVYCADEKLDRICIQVNLSKAKFTQVLLNDEMVDFAIDSNNTVTVGERSLLLHFDGTGPAATAASWTGTRATVSIDSKNGVLKGSTTGGDPYVTMSAATNLGYVFQPGDVVEVRMKATLTTGSVKGFQVFYGTRENPSFGEKRSAMNANATPNGTYQVYTMDANARGSVVGQTLTHLRVDVIGGLSDSTALADYAIDYIYIGPKDGAPSQLAGGLYFGFDNSTDSKARYAGAAYGDRNFDEGSWNYNPARNTQPFFDYKQGTMSIALMGTGPYLQTTNYTGKSNVVIHNYKPGTTDVLQMRVKFNNCAVASGSPSLRLYYIKNNATTGVANSDYFTASIDASAMDSNKYITISCNASDAFKAASSINAIRPVFNNICSAAGKVGMITIDYIYIGPAAEAPAQDNDRLFFDFTNTKADIERYKNSVYGSQNYDIGNWVGSPKRNTTPVFNNAAGTLSYNLVNGVTSSYLQPCNISYSTLTGPLSYSPKAGDMVQIRFMLTNFTTISGTTPTFDFYYLKDNSESGIQGSDRAQITLPAAAVTSGKYMTVTLALPESFTGATVINTIRPCFAGITNVSGKTATVTIDYVAVGQKASLPKTPYLVTFVDAAGKTLETRYASYGDEVFFGGTAPTKAGDSSGHYSLSGWANASGTKLDLSKITADTKVYPYFTKTAHTYKYTNNTSNHIAKCSVCGYSTTQNHVWGSATVIQPNCTAAGTRTYKCSCGATKTETIPAKGHTIVTIPAVAATCTKTGLTAGKKCSVCGTVTVAQQTVAKTAHVIEIIPAVAATCTKTGLTEGKMCSDCGTVTVAQKTVAKTGHKAVADPAVAATCTTAGKTAGSHCSVCKAVIKAQTTVAKLGHNYSKYTNTNGSKHTIKCSRCTASTTAAHKYTNYKCVCGDMTSPKMLFNFNNSSSDKTRYNVALYGKTNFDTTAAWGTGGGRVSKVAIDTSAGTIAMTIASGKNSPYIQTKAVGGNLTSGPLNYYPRSGDVVQLRFKMTNCKAVSGMTPDLRIYFIKNNGTAGVKNSDFTKVNLNTNAAFCGDWIIMTVPMTANFTDASVINALRVSFNGVEAVAGKTASITLQYICVGQRTSMPNDYRLYMNFTNTTADQKRFKTALYGTFNYDTGYWGYNAGRSTKPVYNATNGTLSFNLTSGGNQPYIQTTDSTGSLASRPMKYNPEAGDTLKIRFKLTNCKAMSGVTPALRLYYIKNYSTGGVVGSDYTAQKLDVKTAFSGNYVTITMPLNSTFTTARFINAIRINFAGIEAVAGKTGTVTIDYIAIGQSNELP